MNGNGLRVLVVDDDAQLLRALNVLLQRAGFQVRVTNQGAETLLLAEQFDPDVILLDLKMPPPDGMTLLRELKSRSPSHEVVIITAQGTTDRVIDAIKEGAYWFLDKPFDQDAVIGLIKRAGERRLLSHRSVEQVRSTGLVGRSAPIRNLRDMIKRLSDDPVTVLITGESGTGKEVAARAIHELSPRNGYPFEAINCGAIPQHLIESELFGHERGAFTDAVDSKAGLFERARGGTVLLDEVGELPLAAQVKLLRVLQEREVRRLGGSVNIYVDVRVIAASNHDLEQLVAEDRFREDLFYRLNVFPLQIPPLRERVEDIPSLAHHFLKLSLLHEGRRQKRIERINAEAMDLLQSYEWKGNVRELRNTIERAVVICDGSEITPEFLPAYLRDGVSANQPQKSPDELSRMDWDTFRNEHLPAEHRRWLRALLTRYGNNIARAARLGARMDRANFRKLLQKYDAS